MTTRRESTATGAVRRALCRLIARYYLRKPDLEGFLALRFPGLRALGVAALNELAYRTRGLVGYRLTAVNFESTNRCNLRCVMCPVNRDMKRPRTDMPIDVFRSAVDGAGPIDVALLFQWGEPFLLPDIFERIRHAASRGIRVMLTTNGTLLDEDLCRRICRAPIERLTFSVDGLEETHAAIRGQPLASLLEAIGRLARIRDESGSPLRIDVNATLWERNDAEARALRERLEPLVDRVQFIPRFADGRRTRPCRELWRGSAVVLSNGDVVPCCRDSEGELRVGNIREAPLAAIWRGKAMQGLRAAHARREFPPLCARCAEFSSALASPRFG